jgi:hypothetical protein
VLQDPSIVRGGMPAAAVMPNEDSGFTARLSLRRFQAAYAGSIDKLNPRFRDRETRRGRIRARRSQPVVGTLSVSIMTRRLSVAPNQLLIFLSDELELDRPLNEAAGRKRGAPGSA